MSSLVGSRRFCALAATALLGVGCTRDPNIVKQKHVESGNRYYQSGRYKEAAIMYRRALTKDKMYGEAYYRLALTELKTGDLQGAVRDLYRTTQLQADNADATGKLIDIFLAAYAVNSKDSANVRIELEGLAQKLLSKNPNSYDGARVKGYLALMKSDFPEARQWFEKAIALQPDKPEVVVALTQVLTAQKQFEAAEKLALEFLGRHKDALQLYNVLYMDYLSRGESNKAEEILQRKLKANPQVATAYIDLAGFYFRTRKPDSEAVLQQMLDRPKGFLTFPAEAPSSYLLAGGFYQGHGETEKALGLYRTGLSTDSAHKLDYEAKLGQLLLVQEKPAEVRPLVDDILKSNPDNVDGLTMRAALLLQTKKKEDAQAAVADLKKVMNTKPDNAVFRLNLGRALMAAGSGSEALVHFNEAIKLDPGPNTLAARFSAAELYQTQRPEPDFGRAYQTATDILAVDQNSIPARLIRANAEFHLRRLQAVREDLEAILRVAPDQRDALFQLGRLNLSEGSVAAQARDRALTQGDKAAASKADLEVQAKYKSAGLQFHRLEELKDPRGFNGLVEAQAGLGNTGKAIEMLKQDLSEHPEKTEHYLALGNLYATRREAQPSIAAYQESIKRYPDAPDAYIRLGRVYLNTGEYDKALAPLQKAIELQPKGVDPLLVLATVYEMKSDRNKAKPLYEKVLQIQSDHAVALNNLAFLLADEDKDLDAALTYAQRAHQKWPDNHEVTDTLGWIYLRKQLPDRAMPLFEDIVRKDPARASFRLHWAEALYQKQQKEQARRELDTASHSNPNKQEQQQIQALRSKVG